MTAPLIQLKSVSKTFPGVKALDGIDFAIDPAEIVCLAGENGSGKSTLIKIISGVYRPDEGEIRIDGEPFRAASPKDAIARGIQVIYQDFSLFPNLSVAENLALNSLLREKRRLVAPGEMRRLGRAALERLGVDIDLDEEVGGLSTANRQIVAIARALMHDARLIIMDEPTTALTGREVEALFSIVRDIQNSGIAVLFVSHKMREMLEISERMVIFRNGRKVNEGATSSFDEAKITRDMTGQEIAADRFQWRGDRSKTPRIAVDGLTVPGHVEDFALEIAPGEIIGLSGLLGSGRTELALALFGMLPEHEGEVRIDGEPLSLRSVRDAVDAGIAYVPEDRHSEGLFDSQSIALNLSASILDRLSGRLFVDRRRSRKESAAMIQTMRIATPDMDKPVGQLSGGNQQRVVIGRWLMTGARVLILNGPTVGVDVGSKAEIHRQIRQLAEGDGLAVLMISDDVPELLQNCNRILLMHKGRLVEELDPKACDEDGVYDRLKGLK